MAVTMMERLYSLLRVTLNDGTVLIGSTYEEVVKNLWHDSWDAATTVEEYMEKVQKRVVIQTGDSITFHDHESFIKELARVKLVTTIETDVAH
ncbi:hypothetical protein [Heliorestis convoluta]|uniref:Uncharacterized protein n=1 Tax=Heliorestis convoluta TaxID=356322 RepID=A0A5Q2N2X8_9FIRM|nr:hypothetical protein [Heliorestis convoluta]QGG47642.1 hypothetical protein FTV88_1542 [Heliorestis convoluta]